jgi:hypothetical protein
MDRSNTKWTEEDEWRLADLFENGISRRLIAKELKRTPQAVQSRIELLRFRRDKHPESMVSDYGLRASSPVVSLSGPAEALIEHCYSEMLNRRAELHKHYKLKEKPKKAIGALFSDLLRSFKCDGCDRGIKVSTTQFPGMNDELLKAFVHYLEGERMVIRNDTGSILDSTRGDQSKRLLKATAHFVVRCSKFGIDPQNVEIHFRA